ncbi:CHRNA7-FAM7A fusion protein [Liparis tanakae]|uniref:CHRNA7-FAM7A fusion protein n=1 Tax=Liparis tanakae TaxID=230148 RepID=A0A4Z2FEP1_9TELE|nr:CHRNA7-FAM7A fusion protein [Liparis tanakae]
MALLCCGSFPAQYFASTMMIVGMSVVVTVLVLQFHHHDPHGGKMPKWVRVILLNWCAWFLRMKKPGEENKPGGHGDHKYPAHHASAGSVQTGAAAPSTGANGANGHMNLYFGYNPAFPPGVDSGAVVMCGAGAVAGLLHGSASSSSSSPPHAVRPEPLPDVSRILEEVQFIARRLREHDAGAAVSGEWKFAAAVVDRLCLVAFSLFSIN